MVTLIVVSDHMQQQFLSRYPSIGPASYVVNTGDLQVVTLGKVMIKFVNDTYLIIPAANADS